MLFIVSRFVMTQSSQGLALNQMDTKY